MSLYDYVMSLEIGKHDYPFYALVTAAKYEVPGTSKAGGFQNVRKKYGSGFGYL